MVHWRERSSSAQVLHAIRLGFTATTVIWYGLSFFLICDPLTRARNNNNDYLPPGNGHLTDSMNPLVRNAMSMRPDHVMGLDLGLVFANGIGWALHTFWAVSDETPGAITTIGTMIIELLMAASGVLPGLMSVYTLKWWGCRELFYGQDPSNVTENTYGNDACNEFRGVGVMFTMAGASWAVGFLFHLAVLIVALSRKAFVHDDIELRRVYNSGVQQPSHRRENGARANPPAYSSSGPTGFGQRKDGY